MMGIISRNTNIPELREKLKNKIKIMKLLNKQHQNELLDFICEQYMVAVRSNQKGIMKIAQFGQIQSRVFKMAEIVAGKRGATLLAERVASMGKINNQEKKDE